MPPKLNRFEKLLNSEVYIDVILPFRLPQLYTYKVPEELQDQIETGRRAVVQFGRKKVYTALIARVHDEPPELQKAKEVLAIPDDEPILSTVQMQFWDWVSRYYMATLGEVMNAALPAALKLSSETVLEINPEMNENQEFSDREWIALEALRNDQTLTLSQLQQLLEVDRIHPIVQSLFKKGAVLAFETLQERYRPKYEDYLELPEALEDEATLQQAYDSLSRSPKQQKVLETFLAIREERTNVPKQLVLKEAEADNSFIKKLEEKGILKITQVAVDRLSAGPITEYLEHKKLSDEQNNAFQSIKAGFKEHTVTLLHGVTASGKTHIYFELIREQLELGKQVLYLLPEIALTAQIIDRLRSIFGSKVGVYHSRFNTQEQVEIWYKVLTGEYQILLGARSALWLPFKDLGLLIVDEEHDASFKQFDPAPRYQARDAAVYMAGLFSAKVLLGTATPSFESLANARNGKYGYVELKERFGGVHLPKIEVVNIREDTRRKIMKSHFSPRLIKEMREALNRNEQVILFINKRGFAPFMMCLNCGWVHKCKNCDVSLTYHKFMNKQKCHYCGYTTDPPTRCQNCGHTDVRVLGFGTEKIEEDLEVMFPQAVVGRFDWDTTKGKEAHTRIIRQFQNREIHILVGTQMVTKGLDFDNVSLVGILHADQLWSYPEFRANERAFQMIQQVSGRAGRREQMGKVILQTMDPEHLVVRAVVQNNYKDFAKQEWLERRNFSYPPFKRLIKITLKHKQKELVAEAAQLLGRNLRKGIDGQVMGPTYPVIARIKNQYLQEILLKLSKEPGSLSKNKYHLRVCLHRLQHHDTFKSVTVAVNVDP